VTVKKMNSFFAGQIFWPAFFFLCLSGSVYAVSTTEGVYEHVHHTREEAIDKIFGNGHRVSSSNFVVSSEQKVAIESKLGWVLTQNEYVIWSVHSEKNTLLGYAIVLHELGKHQPITFLTAVTPSFKVKDFLLLVYREHRGDEVKKRRFRKQFWGLGRDDSMLIDIDIDGITGATISCWSIAEGVKKALLLVEAYSNEIPKNKNDH